MSITLSSHIDIYYIKVIFSAYLYFFCLTLYNISWLRNSALWKTNIAFLYYSIVFFCGFVSCLDDIINVEFFMISAVNFRYYEFAWPRFKEHFGHHHFHLHISFENYVLEICKWNALAFRFEVKRLLPPEATTGGVLWKKMFLKS